MRRISPLHCLLLVLAGGALAACETEPTPKPTVAADPNANPCASIVSLKAHALAHGDATTRTILQNWDPPRPVSLAERPAVETIARDYMARCGTHETLELLTQLGRFATVNDGLAARDSAPLRAMQEFLRDWSQRAHLHFEAQPRAEVWEVTLGSGPHLMTLLAHADVVPPGPGWTHEPFMPQVQNDRVYGRGMEDDKGPIAAALVVLHTMAGLGLQPPGRITLTIGAGGEGDWSAMQKYARDEPRARYVLGLNGAFPVTIAEDGIATWYLGAPAAVRGRSRGPLIDSVVAGVGATQVPGEAKAHLKPASGQAAADLLKKAHAACERGAKKHRGEPYRCTASAAGEGVELLVTGRAASTANPERGANALALLAGTVKDLDVQANGAAVLLRAAQILADSGAPKKLGLAHTDTLTGSLVMTPALLRCTPKDCHLDVRIHRPRGDDSNDFARELAQAEVALQKQIDGRIASYAPPIVNEAVLANAPDSLTRSLTGIYQRLAAEPHTQPTAIRDTTYARLFPGAVSVGPQRPGKPSTAHGPDEYIEIGTLGLMGRAYLDAILLLEIQK